MLDDSYSIYTKVSVSRPISQHTLELDYDGIEVLAHIIFKRAIQCP